MTIHPLRARDADQPKISGDHFENGAETWAGFMQDSIHSIMHSLCVAARREWRSDAV